MALREVILASSQGGPSLARRAAAVVEERYLDAAAAFSEIGDVTDEAYARLLTGEPRELERALVFYRSVGATRYIREAEALLAASA